MVPRWQGIGNYLPICWQQFVAVSAVGGAHSSRLASGPALPERDRHGGIAWALWVGVLLSLRTRWSAGSLISTTKRSVRCQAERYIDLLAEEGVHLGEPFIRQPRGEIDRAEKALQRCIAEGHIVEED